jgi:pimeloyl-ACP methyl ester carboxylesterase
MNSETARSGAYADLPGVKLWFIDTGGAGDPIMLLHPNTGTVAIWEPQISAFVQAGYRVIAFDRRGWGKSTPDPAASSESAGIAGDLHALAEHLRLDAFHLLGVAGGGFIALDYAAWHPQPYRRRQHRRHRGQRYSGFYWPHRHSGHQKAIRALP